MNSTSLERFQSLAKRQVRSKKSQEPKSARGTTIEVNKVAGIRAEITTRRTTIEVEGQTILTLVEIVIQEAIVIRLD